MRHSHDREPPIPIYIIGLCVHSLYRSRKLIEQLYSLGNGKSYDRVIQPEKSMALTLCGQYQANDIVCPTHLKKGLFTIGAMGNIDHNPSSTAADSSFHGTGISIIQFPTANNTGTAIEPVSTTATKSLPQSYTVVPAVALNPSKAAVTKRLCENVSGHLVDGMLQEKCGSIILSICCSLIGRVTIQ